MKTEIDSFKSAVFLYDLYMLCLSDCYLDLDKKKKIIVIFYCPNCELFKFLELY